jgi:sugar phosphate isomerase/epimerase
LRQLYPYEFIWHYEEMLDFALSISRDAGLVIDAWHWHHGGANADAIRAIPADRILDVHIADSPMASPDTIRDSERLLPGEGIIDFKLFFQLLDEKAYHGQVAVEVFGRGLAQMSPHEAAELTFGVSTAMLRGVGLEGPAS